MIARIHGVLLDISHGAALVQPEGSGAAYEVHVPPALADSLAARIGEVVTLHTLQTLESNNQGAAFTPRMLGFASREDRAFFELLTKVRGLGPRRALRAMAAPSAHIAAAIVAGDAKYLATLPEIGKRVAETIIAELRDKAAHFARPAHGADALAPGAHAPAVVTVTNAARTALDALVRLGESRADAERLVHRALEQHPELDSPDAILAAAFGARDR